MTPRPPGDISFLSAEWRFEADLAAIGLRNPPATAHGWPPAALADFARAAALLSAAARASWIGDEALRAMTVALWRAHLHCDAGATADRAPEPEWADFSAFVGWGAIWWVKRANSAQLQRSAARLAALAGPAGKVMPPRHARGLSGAVTGLQRALARSAANGPAGARCHAG